MRTKTNNSRASWADVKPERVKPSTGGGEAYGAVTGTLVGMSDSGEAIVRVTVDGVERTMPARTTTALGPPDVDGEALVVFDRGNVRAPIVIGILRRTSEGGPKEEAPREGAKCAIVDGERVVISGQKEVSLRCGKASITLTRAGKVLIRGEYVLSRSSGANALKGASVQIN